MLNSRNAAEPFYPLAGSGQRAKARRLAPAVEVMIYPPMVALAEDQLARIESLGLNCEIGNVLRRLGNDTPSLFRWTWAPPRSVLALLDANFSDLYDPGSMEPGHHDEIRDPRYDIWFHTNLRTGDPDGGRAFRFIDPDEAKRIRVLRAEKSVVDALVDRFRKRMTAPDTLFVLTRHAREAEGSAEAIVAALRAHAGQTPLSLLEVLPAVEQAQIGRVVEAGDDLYQGYVSRFAPHDAANDIDLESWTHLLAAALAVTAGRSRRRFGLGRRSNAIV